MNDVYPRIVGVPSLEFIRKYRHASRGSDRGGSTGMVEAVLVEVVVVVVSSITSSEFRGENCVFDVNFSIILLFYVFELSVAARRDGNLFTNVNTKLHRPPLCHLNRVVTVIVH